MCNACNLSASELCVVHPANQTCFLFSSPLSIDFPAQHPPAPRLGGEGGEFGFSHFSISKALNCTPILLGILEINPLNWRNGRIDDFSEWYHVDAPLSPQSWWRKYVLEWNTQKETIGQRETWHNFTLSAKIVAVLLPTLHFDLPHINIYLKFRPHLIHPNLNWDKLSQHGDAWFWVKVCIYMIYYHTK